MRKVFEQSGKHDETMTQGCGHKKKTEGKDYKNIEIELKTL